MHVQYKGEFREDKAGLTGEESVTYPNQHQEQDQADKEAPGNEPLFYRQQRLSFHPLNFFRYFRLVVGHNRNIALRCRQGWFDSMEEQPRNCQTDPQDESKQAEDINRGKTRDPFLPQVSKIRCYANRKESEDEEEHSERVGSCTESLGKGKMSL